VIPADPVCFLLDFDGTLVDIAETPEDVVVPPGLASRLTALEARGDRVAVVTGRRAQDVRDLLPGVFVVGLHGLEWPGDPLPARDPDLDRALAAVSRIPRVRIEDKGLALAVHWRQAGPDREHFGADAAALLAEAAARSEGRLSLLRGKCVEELRPAGATKASAIVRLCASAPTFVVLFAGDDQTDEEAFDVLPAPAITIRVGPRGVPTAARFRVDDPSALRVLLARAVDR
jgi:trehalose 6-phosphate phosphatase